MYFKTSEQQLFGKIWDAICTISNIKLGITRISLKFRHKNQRKHSLFYINSMYQVSTFYSEKSLSNQKVLLQLLKSSVTSSILKLQ